MRNRRDWHEHFASRKETALAPEIRKPSEILAMEFQRRGFFARWRLPLKRRSYRDLRRPGRGEIPPSMQLMIALVTGRPFLGWQTNVKGTRWLILQTETATAGSNMSFRMMSDLTKAERQAVDDGIDIHTLETAEDSFVSLKLPENEMRISALIQERAPTGVVFDVLRDYQIGDLNGDEG